MLVSFRQTYGDGRKLLYDILSRDQKLIDLYNLCDLNLHSFHNCSKETIGYYKDKNIIKNSEYLYFNDMPYSKIIELLKIKLEELETTHFLFTQDDTFSGDQDLNWNELIDYSKEHQKKFMVNLFWNTDRIDCRIPPDEIKKTFNVFHLTTRRISDECNFGMDDSPYICTLDVLDEIYDSIYCKKGSVWECESYLFDKYRYRSIDRYLISDYSHVLQNYNLFGRTLGKRENDMAKLKKKKLL